MIRQEAFCIAYYQWNVADFASVKWGLGKWESWGWGVCKVYRVGQWGKKNLKWNSWLFDLAMLYFVEVIKLGWIQCKSNWPYLKLLKMSDINCVIKIF